MNAAKTYVWMRLISDMKDENVANNIAFRFDEAFQTFSGRLAEHCQGSKWEKMFVSRENISIARYKLI